MNNPKLFRKRKALVNIMFRSLSKLFIAFDTSPKEVLLKVPTTNVERGENTNPKTNVIDT